MNPKITKMNPVARTYWLGPVVGSCGWVLWLRLVAGGSVDKWLVASMAGRVGGWFGGQEESHNYQFYC